MQPEPGQVHDLPPLYKEGLGSGVEGTYACPPQGYAVGGNRGSKREPARVGPGGGVIITGTVPVWPHPALGSR
jgi:hypothetical protein